MMLLQICSQSSRVSCGSLDFFFERSEGFGFSFQQMSNGLMCFSIAFGFLGRDNGQPNGSLTRTSIHFEENIIGSIR